MTDFSQPSEARFLRLPDVLARYGCSRATVYAWMARGDFPAPVKLGCRLVAWRRHDLETRESSMELGRSERISFPFRK